MRRSLLVALVLALVGQGVAAAPARGESLGRFVRVIRKVEGKLGDKPLDPPPKPKDQVDNGLLVTTKEASAARIALGVEKAQGAVTIGPDSKFKLQAKFIADRIVGKFNLEIEWGNFLFQFLSSRLRPTDPKLAELERELGAVPQTVVVTTPNNTEIVLHGTEVFVFVDRGTGATSVYVSEGSVSIRRGGTEVTVPSGQWSYVPPTGLPTPPAPIPPGDHGRDPWQPPGPDGPFINPRDPRLGLDLPR